MPIKYNLIAVLGPTASGKTSVAAHLAYRLNGEVISADSRQVYRKMDLGTGKDYADYLVNNSTVPSHLIDIVDPGYRYSVYEYQRDFFSAFLEISARHKFPVLCGGSGMYIDAATRGYRLINVPQNPMLRKQFGSSSLEILTKHLAGLKNLHNTSDIDTPERALRAIEIATYYRDHPALYEDQPAVSALYIGIRFERQEERARITARLKSRLDQGMLEEVKNLLNAGLSADDLAYYGLEYRFITAHLTGQMDYQTMFSRLNTAIHQFAKRQRTWFRKMEHEGCIIHWLDGNMAMPEKIDTVLGLMEQ